MATLTHPDDENDSTGRFSPGNWRQRRGSKILLDDSANPQKDPERRAIPENQTPEQVERFPALYPQEIEHDCRSVRLDVTFDEPIRIRDQAEIIVKAMQEIIELTKKHDLGSVQQRRLARFTAAVCGRTLSRFNGKTPYGEYRKKRK